MLFRGEYYFLSNMFPCRIAVRGMEFSCVESAFQAYKFVYAPEFMQKFVRLNGFEAKRLGRAIRLPERLVADWDSAKDNIMLGLLGIKFSDHKLAELLLKTGDLHLQEDNSWHDVYWGVCNGQGQNRLGELLMQVRATLHR